MTSLLKIVLVMKMKRKILSAIIVTAALLCSCSEAEPKTVAATLGSYTRDIVGYGSVTMSDMWTATAEKGAVVGNAHVQAGEKVSKGDTLLSVFIYGNKRDITSDCDGIIYEISGAGTSSDGKKPLCIIAKTDSLSLSVLINEKDIADIKEGDTVNISGDGLGNTVGNGRVSKIFSLPEQSDTAIFYRAEIKMPENAVELLPGMSVKAVVHSSSNSPALLIPYSAVGFDSEGYYVYTDRGKRIALSSAKVCNEGYAITGLDEGQKILEQISEAEE